MTKIEPQNVQISTCTAENEYLNVRDPLLFHFCTDSMQIIHLEAKGIYIVRKARKIVKECNLSLFEGLADKASLSPEKNTTYHSSQEFLVYQHYLLPENLDFGKYLVLCWS